MYLKYFCNSNNIICNLILKQWKNKMKEIFNKINHLNNNILHSIHLPIYIRYLTDV